MKAYDESITTMKESVYARMKMTQSTNVNVSKLKSGCFAHAPGQVRQILF